MNIASGKIILKKQMERLENQKVEVEFTHISSNGIWMLTHEEELFLSYEDFPWFKDQKVKAILNVEELKSGHFYWPEIDVDLTLDMIKHPERFPLRSKTS